MSTPLPSRPNLEHLRNEAGGILKAHTSDDRSVCAVLKGLRRFSGATDDAIMRAEVTLQEVQLALAIKYGFKDWASLRDAVRGTAQAVAVVNVMYKPSPEAATKLEQLLASGPASGWSMPQLVGFFKAVAGLWLDNALLAPVPARLDDPFLRAGLELVVNGSGYDEIRSVMAVRERTILAEDERRYDIGTTALVAIGWAEHPKVLEERCRALLDPGAPVGKPVSDDGTSRKEELEALLAAKPARAWSLLELIEFMKTSLGVARAGGLLALDDIPERLDDPFLKAPFRLLVDGCDVEIVRSVLLDRKRTLVAERERRCNMIITALCGMAAGDFSGVIEAKCRAFLPE